MLTIFQYSSLNKKQLYPTLGTLQITKTNELIDILNSLYIKTQTPSKYRNYYKVNIDECVLHANLDI